MYVYILTRMNYFGNAESMLQRSLYEQCNMCGQVRRWWLSVRMRCRIYWRTLWNRYFNASVWHTRRLSLFLFYYYTLSWVISCALHDLLHSPLHFINIYDLYNLPYFIRFYLSCLILTKFVILIFRNKPNENTRADWFNVVFLLNN